jgi:hypothetical protein
VTDIAKQPAEDLQVIEAEYGWLPDLGKVDFDRDVFSPERHHIRVRVPNSD